MIDTEEEVIYRDIVIRPGEDPECEEVELTVVVTLSDDEGRINPSAEVVEIRWDRKRYSTSENMLILEHVTLNANAIREELECKFALI